MGISRKEGITSPGEMITGRRLLWLLIASIAFIGINSVFLHTESFFFSLVPLGIVMALLCLYSLDISLMVLIAFVPVSVQLIDLVPGVDVNLYLPTEPFMLMMTLVFWYKVLLEGNYPRSILVHPLSLAILFHLAWLGITTISSSMPLVSAKFLLSRVWFITVFYFIGIIAFRNKKLMENYMIIYTVSLSLVVIYALIRLQGAGFWNQEAAHSSSSPIFNDHTSFGAVITMALLVLAVYIPKANFNRKIKILIWPALALLVAGLVFSYSRAAWISALAASGIYAIVKLRIRPVILLSTGVLIFIMIAFSWTDIVMKLEKNKQDSSAEFSEQIQSISNIRTDASNVERINRWESALGMFKEKPLFGWGPGTYMFNYASFQSSRNRTIISTNFGDMGNAHSEYLGPLSETGVPGMLSVILIIGMALYYGINNYLKGKKMAWLSLGVSIALASYAIHGLLNNFLDTDKASALFWGFMAIIVAIDRSDYELKAEDGNIIK